MPLESDVSYTCPACFEDNAVGIDPGGGSKQRLIEDCPVCCRPIVFTVARERSGDFVLVSAEPES